MALSLGNNTNFLIPQASSPLTGSLNLNSSDSLKLEFTPSKTGYYIFDFSQQENAFTSPAYILLADNDSNSYMPGQMTTFNHRDFPIVELTGGKKYYLILRHVDSSYYGSYINITISEGYKFTATINPSGVARFTTPSLQIVKIGEIVNFNPLLLDDSYMLNNWTKDGNILTEVSWGLTLTATTSNHGEYIANFIKKPPDPVYYEVDLHFYPSNYGGAVILEKGTSSGSFLEGTPITLFANPNLGPYTFQGWYLDSTYAESKLISTEPKYSTVVTKDIDYYAKFQVTANVSEGQEKTYTVLQEDQRINISYRPTSDANGKPVIFETTGDVDLSGVLYIYNNGWSSLGTVIKTGEKREYTFPSNADQNSYLLSIVCNEELDTKKSFNFSSYIKNYNITFIVDNIIYATQKKIYDTNLTLLSETPSKAGYTFKGWGTTSTSTTASYQPGGTYSYNSDLTLYAIWSLDTFTLSYDVNGGSGSFSDQTGDVNYTISSTRPTRIGYNFQGWALTNDAEEAIYQPGGNITINKNTTLYAVWTQETISSKTSKDTTISYAKQIYWYKFTPTTAGEYVMYSTGSSDTYGYIYNSSGTSLDVDDDEGDSTNFRVSYSLSANTPYYFGVKYLNSSSTGTIRINLGPVYTISYNNNGGGTAPSSQSKDWNKNITLSSNTLTRNYYKFEGWSTDASATESQYNKGASFSANENTTLYAVWTPIDYSITYNLNGGKVATENPISYNTETNTFTLNNPTRDGYNFTGWTGTNGTTPSTTITITKGSGGNRTYTANWNNKIFTITLDNQSANTSGTTKAYLKYNNGWYSNLGATTQITAITKPTKAGHTFKGYYTQENGQGDCIINSDGTPQSNIFTLSNTTIYAHWTINYYTLTDDINTDNSQGTYNGNYYSITHISGDKIGNTYSYGSKIKLIATPNAAAGYNFSYWKINDSYENSQECVYTIVGNTTITAYFSLGKLSITINLYQEGNPNIFNIPMGQEKDYVKLWIRDYNNTSYDGWEQKPFNTELSYANAKNIQIVIEDGEKYEFLSSDFTQYESIPVNKVLTYKVYFKEIPEINSIYLGKSDKPYSSGYIKDPNLSFEEEISSIWVGGEQIMGKAPKRPYPYVIDSLLGDTLYIGLYSSVEDWKNGKDMKTTVPAYKYQDNTNIKKVRMFNNITTISTQAFRECLLDSIQLSKNLESIDKTAFYDTSDKLKIIFIPSSVSYIYPSWSTFGGYSNTIEKFIVNPNNLNYSSDNQGALYNKEKTELIIYPTGRRKTSYILPFIKGTINTENCFINSNLQDIYYKGTKSQWDELISCTEDTDFSSEPITVHCSDGEIFTIYY